MIQITPNWRINVIENNCILEYYEMRSRKKKDDTEEPYEYVDSYYYPTIQSCLKGYLHKGLEPSKTMLEILSRMNEIEATIKNLKIEKNISKI